MILYRPHRITLESAMKEKRYFKSLQEMIEYIVYEHNKSQDFFKISSHDLNISLYSYDGDKRVGWHDLFVVCFESYDRIKDKIGYKKYFGGEEYHHPVGVLGFFTTDF